MPFNLIKAQHFYEILFLSISNRRSRLSPADPHSSSSEASFTDESKEFEVEFDRLSQLSSNMPMPMNNLFVGLPNADTKADVEPIVPLENALSNMNQILKNLAQTAEKKVT